MNIVIERQDSHSEMIAASESIEIDKSAVADTFHVNDGIQAKISNIKKKGKCLNALKNGCPGDIECDECLFSQCHATEQDSNE